MVLCAVLVWVLWVLDSFWAVFGFFAAMLKISVKPSKEMLPSASCVVNLPSKDSVFVSDAIAVDTTLMTFASK